MPGKSGKGSGGNPHPNNLFTSDNQPKNRGRKPSKIKAFKEEVDLSYEDVKDLIKMVFDKTEEELKALGKDKTAPMLLRGIAVAFADDIKNGKLYNINSMLDRLGFKPVDKKQISGNLGISDIKLSDEENEMFKKNLNAIYSNVDKGVPLE